MKTLLHHFKVSTLVICALLGSLITNAQDPDQYGTPYTGVPDAPDAVIYQVNMRCFSSTRNFQGVINRLDNIKALGVNVIYLMPFYPVGTVKAFNSPYCIKDLKAVGAEFGTLTDLRNLVDKAHEKGMAVMIDWVTNQTSWDHPWITAHKDWYQQDASGNIKQFSTYSDVAALNFANTSMKAAMIEAMRYWVFTANIDGFRCDFANNPPIDFWQQAITSLRGITTHKLLLLAEGDRTTNYTAGFDFNFGFNFYYNSILPIYKNNSPATLINNSNTSEYAYATADQRVARYLSNHDIYGSDGSPYTIFKGKKGTLAAFVVASYMKSVPFIYNGMEVGNTVSMPFPFTSSVINWTQDVTITPEMTNIITIRNNSNAIRRGTLTSYSNADVCAFKKELETEQVFVLSNLRNAAKTFNLPSGIANTTMRDEMTDTDVVLGTAVDLLAYEYKIFSKTIPVSVSPLQQSVAFETSIYPNPATDGVVKIKRTECGNRNANLTIFDAQGRICYESTFTESDTTIDLTGFSKGWYIIRIGSVGNYNYHKLLIN